MQKQTVVMVNTVRGGSHGRIMGRLQQMAREEGLRTYVAFARGPGQQDGQEIRIGGKLDVMAHGVASRLLDRHAFYSGRATRALIGEVEKRKPDLIHMHNLHGYYLHVGRWFDYLRRAGVPVIWTLHDCWAMTGHCSHFVRAGCDRWRTGCFHCPLKGEYPASYGLDQSRRNWKEKRAAFTGLQGMTIVAPSQWLGGVVRDSFLGGYPLRVIPNGIDLKVFAPRDEGIDRARVRCHVPEGRAMLLSVALPFDERKGLSGLIALADRLKDEARLVLVGLTEKQVKALPPHITGIERTESREELALLYTAADAFVNMTMEDTYPTVNMEAMACGTPVICHNVCGCTEQVPEACGRLVSARDLDAFTRAVREVLARGRASYSGVCRAYAKDHFDEEAPVEAYRALYREALKR